MALRSGHDREKLEQLAQTQNVPTVRPLIRLGRLTENDVPNFVNSVDEQRAEQCLSEGKSSKVVRKPTIKLKGRIESFEVKSITNVLPTLIEANEGAGVVQALLNRDHKVSSVKKDSTRQTQIEERDLLLLKAVEAQNVDMVWLLAPRTSARRKNEALTVAVNMRHSALIKKLLEYDADPNHCSREFLTAAAKGDLFVVEHLLCSYLPMEEETLINALMPAVQADSLQVVQRIVSSADMHVLQDVPAVGEAAKRGYIDILLTILLSADQVRSGYLGKLVLEVFNNVEINATTVMTILQALFAAGASGSKCSAAMRLAVEQQSLDFVQFFAQNKVDVNWGAGHIVKSAVHTGRCDLLREVLTSGDISRDNASATVEALPRNLPPQTRLEMLRMLIRAGAYGSAVENELVLAVQNDDQDLVTLLRSEGVSIDNQQGDALIAAVQTENVKLLSQLLDGPVSQSSLQNALPSVRPISKMSRLLMTKLLVRAKVEGEAVDVALRDAVCDETPNRDQDLIDVLIQAGGDATYEDAITLRHAIRHDDTQLFEKLLASPAGVSEGVVSSLVPVIMDVKDRDVRFYMLRCALATRPREQSVTSALLKIVSEKDTDAPLLKLLIRSGRPDINYQAGCILVRGCLHANMLVLEELMKLSNRSRDTTANALVILLEQKDWGDEIKALRTAMLMSSGNSSMSATLGLAAYVKFWKASGSKGRDWPMRTFDLLLAAGADVNVSQDVLVDSTKAASIPLLGALIRKNPSASIVDKALLKAVSLSDDDRNVVVKMLADSTPSMEGLSSALLRASQKNLENTCALLLKYNTSLEYQNFAAIRHTITSDRLALLAVFLKSSPAKNVIEAAFEEAKNIVDISQRCKFMEAIFKAGINRDLLSSYLIDVVDERSTDGLVELLLNYEADIHYQHNQSSVLASTENRLSVLQLLFARSNDKLSVATQCFEACVEGHCIKQDYIPLLEYLLVNGASGHSLNIALQQVVYKVKEQPALIHLLKLLIAHGADVNDDYGHALCHACESATPDIVYVFIEGRPSVAVRSRAIHSLLRSTGSESDFCETLNLLMQNGLQPGIAPTLSMAKGGFENPLRVLLSTRPNGVVELAHVLEHQGQILRQPENEDIMAWAMSQKKPQINDECLALLINNGANVSYRNPLNEESLLLQAIRTQRSHLVALLLTHGADSSVADADGMSPLMLASVLGDRIVAASLLEFGAPKNDGSLHHAVRSLNVRVVEVLLKNNHDPNHLSAQSQGRTPLAELLYAGHATAQNCSTVERVIQLLRTYGADTVKAVSRKPLICWALDNKHDPIQMAQALLGAYLHKEIDEAFNLYTDGGFCYSPTMYVKKGQFKGVKKEADRLVAILRNWGANRDVYYSLVGPQPDDAEGMPEELAQIERIRRAKIAMRKEEEEERARQRKIEEEDLERQIAHRKRLELEDQRIATQRHDLNIKLNAEAEIAKQKELHSRHKLQLSMTQELANAEQRALLDRIGIQEEERQKELDHRTGLNTLELDTTRQRLLLESENQKTLAAEAQRALSAQIAIQQQLLLKQNEYSEKHHKRRMEQLAYEKARPIGWQPSGGGYIEYN